LRVDDRTFDGWVREHHRLLFGLAYWWARSGSDAEELTQEAFFQAYRSRHTLQDAKAAKAWLVGILRHTFLRTLRKQRNSYEAPLEDADQLPGTDRSLNPDVLALHKAIRQLDERYQLPVVLFYFQELSYKEIAEALDLPMGTVMSRLSRGRQLLHATLQSSQRPSIVKEIRRA
jgi:RNA polymerase sigma-70 factor, ECF subfamily